MSPEPAERRARRSAAPSAEEPHALLRELRGAGPRPLSVSEFLFNINELLETQVAWVEGEVTDFLVSQGKFVHFDLKDAASLVHCFGLAFRLRIPLEDGLKVRVWGVPRVYPRYGKFSLVVDVVEPAGEGALRRTFELLRAKLAAEGLFAAARKRALPRFPERIALVTSPEAAAYHDFLKVLGARRGGLDVLVVPVPVQGEGAAETVAAAIDWVNEHEPGRDALALVRGGGSLEDLRVFNDEIVARALARSRIPTVVGIGHERDVTLADLVADLRASTPSNAAELLTPTKEELERMILDLVGRTIRLFEDELYLRERAVAANVQALRETVAQVLEHVSLLAREMLGTGGRFRERARSTGDSLVRYKTSLKTRFLGLLATHSERVSGLERLLGGLAPERILERGYSITRGASGQILKDARAVAPGERLVTTLAHGMISSVTELTHGKFKGTAEFHEGVRGAGEDRRRV